MAKLDVRDFEQFDSVFSHLAEIPSSVKEDALRAMGAVAAVQIKRTGERMSVRDPNSDVHILDNIKLQKPKSDKSGGKLDITFAGTRTRYGIETRNAEIAFINEYGKRGQPARPFVGTTMEQSADIIAAPGSSLLWDYLEKEFEK